jgi:hypothetical protein
MTDALTIAAVWDGSGLILRRNSAALLDEAFGAGETLALEVQAMRSMNSHRHYFATLRDLWANLPETLASAPYAKSPETLRAHALIATGFADAASVDCGSKAAAERVAAFMASAGGYAVIQVSGSVVRRWTAQSQSVRAMGGREFQRSKVAVMEWCETLVKGEAV